jgi:hypothetical protein
MPGVLELSGLNLRDVRVRRQPDEERAAAA